MVLVEIDNIEAVILALDTALDDGDLFFDADEEKNLRCIEDVEQFRNDLDKKLKTLN